MTDFTDILMSRARLVGITNGADLAARTKIPRGTVYRHLADGNWSRDQLIALHRVIGLDEEAITAYLGREVIG